MITSQKINANFRIEEDLKNSASELAKEMWTSLSSVVNMFLKKFVREKKIEINLNSSNDIWNKYDNAKKEFDNWEFTTVFKV